MNPEPLVTFGMPQWLWALVLVPLGIALFARAEACRKRALAGLVATRLHAELAGSVSHFKRRLRFALLLGALACFIAALAQPRHGFTLEKSKQKGRDVLLAVDTSRSMLATDVKPNRLERAKFAAQDLIGSLQGDRVGLLAFAGSSFLQAPLTVDYPAVLDSLNELDTKIIPLGGTNLADAIRSAMRAFGKGESDHRVLVVFTDGEDLSADALEAAKKAAGAVHIFTVGVGSADGSLIPVPNENGGTEFIKGPDGQFVKSRLDERTLSAVAQAGGGFYTHLQNSPGEMRRLVEAGLGRLEKGEHDTQLSRHPIERYQWPLGLGIALLAGALLINERRGRKPANRATTTAATFLLLALASSPARADEGVALFQQGKYEKARRHFEATAKWRPGLPELEFNKGAAEYAMGDLDSASVAFGKALATHDTELRSKTEYNLGTTLLKRALSRDELKQSREREADLKNAVQHLEEALKSGIKNRNAQTNLDIAKRELAKPKPTPPPQQQKQNDQKDQKKDENKDQNKDQQSKDQQSKEQGQQDQTQRQPGAAPSPTPGEEKKLSGDIKANDASTPEESEAAEAPVKPGEMSPSQARALLDSLKGEDEQPFKIQQRSPASVLKDW